MSLLVYACITMLGMVLVKNSGKIAGAVISGNPSMGLGDVVNQARGMSAAMHHASQEMKQFGNQVKGAAMATQQFGGKMADINAARAGAQSTYHQTLDGLRAAQENKEVSSRMTEKDMKHEAKAARRSYASQAGKQMFGDAAYKMFTGRDRNHEADGALKVGQMFEFAPGQYRQATVGDVQKANAKRAEEAKSAKIDEVKKNPKFKSEVDKPISHLGTPLDAPEPGR